jgi:hypothetical protein
VLLLGRVAVAVVAGHHAARLHGGLRLYEAGKGTGRHGTARCQSVCVPRGPVPLRALKEVKQDADLGGVRRVRIDRGHQGVEALDLAAAAVPPAAAEEDAAAVVRRVLGPRVV